MLIKQNAATEVGADFVGADELVDKIAKENWLDYDVIIATPEMMPMLGKLGKVLGPRGLMPNPKTGTVTTDIKKLLKMLKKVVLNIELIVMVMYMLLLVKYHLMLIN